MSEQWWQNCVQEKSSDLFLGRFVAGRPGRKQEVSVVVVGTGGEQKNWSRLEGKWVWWALPAISEIPTDHKQIHLLALETVVLFRERLSKDVARWLKTSRTDLRELKSWSQTRTWRRIVEFSQFIIFLHYLVFIMSGCPAVFIEYAEFQRKSAEGDKMNVMN